MSWRRPVLGVALGGGAARGLAHLGVLEVLEDEGIRPEVLVGTSFGALVAGALLARDWDVRGLVSDVVDYVHGEEFRRSQLSFFRRKRAIEQTGLLYNLRQLVKRGIYYGFSMTRASFIAAEEFRTSISSVVPDLEIDGLPGRFAAVAADLYTGEEVVISSGSLQVAVQASCAIPGVMPPVDIGAGRTCIDGGWVNKVPVEPARALGADVVLAVDVSDDLADTSDLTTGLNVILRGDAIKAHRLKRIQLTRANVVVSCPLTHVDWADFTRVEEIVEIGRASARRSLPAIHDLVDRSDRLTSACRRAAERALRGVGIVRSARPDVVQVTAHHEEHGIQPYEGSAEPVIDATDEPPATPRDAGS